MATDLISIITPTFRSARYVGRAIESVLGQTYRHIELIVVDDASDDDTVAVCQAYAKKDDRMRVHVRAENGGGAAARNVGIDLASGTYIAFLDADDEWFADKLEKQLAFMRDQSADVSFTAYERHAPDGTPRSLVRVPANNLISYDRLLKRNVVGCSTAMVRRTALAGVRFPPLRKRQDYGLWLALARRGAKIVGLNEVLARYHLRKDSLSASRTDLVKYNWRLYREFEGLGIFRSAWIVGRYAAWHFVRKLREH